MSYINRLARRVIQAAPSLAGFASPISWLWRIDMSTADASPVASPYAGEVGTMTLAQVDGTLAVASGAMVNTAQATPAEGDLGGRNTVAIPRESGVVLLGKYTPSVLNTYPIVAWNTAASVSSVSQELSLRIETILGVNDTGYVSLAHTITTGVEYEFALALFPTGGAVFIRGGAYTNWNLLWVRTTGSTANLYAVLGYYTGTGSLNFLRVRKVASLFPSQFGWATARVTSFTQSDGSNLFLNPNFANWSPANTPTSWVEYNESAGTRDITEVAPANLFGGGGNGALNLRSTSGAFGISQNVAVLGTIYEIQVAITALGSGSIIQYLGGSDGALYTASAVGTYRPIGRSVTGGPTWPAYGGSPIDLTIDDVQLVAKTLNAAVTTTADGMHDFEFTVPASPIAGQEVMLVYRVAAAGEELLNCWVACLRRNATNTAWDFRLDSVAAGVRTNRISVTGVGTPDAIRVIVVGNLHDCFTRTSGAWTKRGSQINNSSYSTATLINTIYSTGTTPTALTSYARSKSSWAELSRTS